MESDSKEMLKIGELAKESGFPVSTIRHYINEGLLGSPRRKNRNMAYYGRESILRISLIKKLQDELFLPLGLIKKILKPSGSLSVNEMDLVIEIRRRLEQDSDLLPKTSGIPESQILEHLELTAEEIAVMEELRVVHPQKVGNKKFYNEVDYRIIKAFSDCRAAGLTAELGFTAHDLIIYIQAIKDLVALESRIFIARMQKNPSVELVTSLILKGLPAVDSVISSLHSKFMMEILKDMVKGAEEP